MTATDVRVHLHFAMTGRYPLSLLDVLFLPDRALVVEYGYVTPFDVVTGSATRRAAAFARTMTAGGPSAALDDAERVREIPYGNLDAIRIHDGGSVGRTKVGLYPSTGPALTVRVHADLDVDALAGALRSVLSAYDASVETNPGIGLGIVERIRAAVRG